LLLYGVGENFRGGIFLGRKSFPIFLIEIILKTRGIFNSKKKDVLTLLGIFLELNHQILE
jgi:hypothetical protein